MVHEDVCGTVMGTRGRKSFARGGRATQRRCGFHFGRRGLFQATERLLPTNKRLHLPKRRPSALGSARYTHAVLQVNRGR